jgi:hypothetical protein
VLPLRNFDNPVGFKHTNPQSSLTPERVTNTSNATSTCRDKPSANQQLGVVKQYHIDRVLRVSFDFYRATLQSISDWLPHELTAQDFFRCVAVRLGADQLSFLFTEANKR